MPVWGRGSQLFPASRATSALGCARELWGRNLLGVINETAEFCSYCQNFWAMGQPWGCAADPAVQSLGLVEVGNAQRMSRAVKAHLKLLSDLRDKNQRGLASVPSSPHLCIFSTWTCTSLPLPQILCLGINNLSLLLMLMVSLFPGLLMRTWGICFPGFCRPSHSQLCMTCPLSRKQSTIDPDVIHCAVMHSESSAKLISLKFEMGDSKTQNRCTQWLRSGVPFAQLFLPLSRLWSLWFSWSWCWFLLCKVSFCCFIYSLGFQKFPHRCSEIVHSVRHRHICICAVPARLQQSQEQESSATTGVCPASALQAVLMHEVIPLLRTPPWENCRNCQCRHHPSAHALADKILCGFLHLVLYVERIVIFRWDRANCIQNKLKGAGIGEGVWAVLTSEHSPLSHARGLHLRDCRSVLVLVARPEHVRFGKLSPSLGQCTYIWVRWNSM